MGFSMRNLTVFRCLLCLVIPFYLSILHADQSAGTQPVLTRPVSKQLADELVKQVKLEFNDAENYLQNTSFFEERGLYGFVKYLKTHYFIEIDHGFAFYNYVVKRGLHFSITPTVSNFHQFDTPLEIFEALLASEIATARHLEQLVSIAHADQDEATVFILHKFIQIQINEIYEIGRIVKRLKFAGDNSAAILILDHQLIKETNELGYISIQGSVDVGLSRGERAVTAGEVGGDVADGAFGRPSSKNVLEGSIV